MHEVVERGQNPMVEVTGKGEVRQKAGVKKMSRCMNDVVYLRVRKQEG